MEDRDNLDDFPVESWMLVRVLPGDTPKAVRMRNWLKQGLRRWGIRCVRLTGQPPAIKHEVESEEPPEKEAA